ncbi:RsmD family RNA methyltransferase [candidate division KSB1 bacterium]|nr:RsmD family RNA methyltransferase [candidate division KSB1 bacterium]
MSDEHKHSTNFSKAQVDPKNRMNDLTSREWLTFQKSWFVLAPQTLKDFILFFTKRQNAEGRASRIGIVRENAEALAPLIRALNRDAVIVEIGEEEAQLDYGLIDLSEQFPNEDSFAQTNEAWLARIHHFARRLKPQAYLTIFTRNRDAAGRLVPIAWQIGRSVSEFLSIKDEKIGCESEAGTLNTIGSTGKLSSGSLSSPITQQPETWTTKQDVIYCLNFRREEELASLAPNLSPSFGAQASLPAAVKMTALHPAQPSWFVPKPPPREKGVLLHPAKFPESLVIYFLNQFSREGERVFDPMAGTGSTLLAALSQNRAAYGIELNPQFQQIAKQRIEKFATNQLTFIAAPQWQIVNGDASAAQSYENLPEKFDYVLTSPPYWDMLRMKGAETQQKRKAAGLLQFYSEDARDLGNYDDYEDFLRTLVEIYERLAERLAAGRYMTIIVKNVKKKGKIYPLAWDLALALSRNLILCHEQFWCQDDLKLAPFGYRYAWVSNTFHHYCLHLRKEE